MSNITTIGFKEFQSKLKNLEGKVLNTTNAYVVDAGLEWSGLAKRSAPVNFGRLRSGISSASIGSLRVEVVSPVKYSPYVEWGTGTRVSVPTDLVNYAIQFKGSRKIIGQNPKAFFFIHKIPIQNKLFAKVQKYLSTAQ